MEETKSTEDKFSFDLPEVEQTKVEIKVEKVGDVCVSCEG